MWQRPVPSEASNRDREYRPCDIELWVSATLASGRPALTEMLGRLRHNYPNCRPIFFVVSSRIGRARRQDASGTAGWKPALQSGLCCRLEASATVGFVLPAGSQRNCRLEVSATVGFALPAGSQRNCRLEASATVGFVVPAGRQRYSRVCVAGWTPAELTAGRQRYGENMRLL